MELRHIRQFIVVAEEGHVTRAAERLGMQQPPLSQRIKAIEKELGVQLFQRKARGVDLTEAGRIFLDNARTILAQYERAFESTRRAARGEHGRLFVGVPPTAPFHPLVPFVIRKFREAFPHVALTMEELLRTELMDRLRNEQTDVAFLRAPLTEAPGLVIHPLLVEPMLLAMPTGHALASGAPRAVIPLKKLADETFIVYARELGPAIYEATIAACLEAGFTPRLGQEAPRITSALGLVAAGLGIAMVPATMERMAMDGVAYRQFRGPLRPTVALQIATRRGETSAVVRNFLSLVRRAAKDFRANTGKTM